jgi:hypothetical protein
MTPGVRPGDLDIERFQWADDRGYDLGRGDGVGVRLMLARYRSSCAARWCSWAVVASSDGSSGRMEAA